MIKRLKGREHVISKMAGVHQTQIFLRIDQMQKSLAVTKIYTQDFSTFQLC